MPYSKRVRLNSLKARSSLLEKQVRLLTKRLLQPTTKRKRPKTTRMLLTIKLPSKKTTRNRSKT